MKRAVVEVRTTIAMRRTPRFCWCLRFLSVVTKISNPSRSAASSKSPFSRVAQLRSYAVETSCRGRDSRRGTGVPWSNSTRIQAGVSVLRAACSRTARTCSRETPGNHCTNWEIRAPSSRFSNNAATGTRVPRNTQAPLTRRGSRSTARQVAQSITKPMIASALVTANGRVHRPDSLSEPPAARSWVAAVSPMCSPDDSPEDPASSQPLGWPHRLRLQSLVITGERALDRSYPPVLPPLRQVPGHERSRQPIAKLVRVDHAAKRLPSVLAARRFREQVVVLREQHPSEFRRAPTTPGLGVRLLHLRGP